MNSNYRLAKIQKLIPKNVKTVLDIGSLGNIFNSKFKTTTIDALENADIKQDLNKNQKLPFKDKSFDMVVLNQILEHLPYVEELVEESRRVSKKYIFLGLPNELTWGFRLRFLLGIPAWKGYLPYWHKHFYTIDTITLFENKFFPKDKILSKDYLGAFSGAGILPWKFRDFLSKKLPTLFAKEVYYIIKLKK
jgi:SAM-dependent methyltransferase